MCDTVTPGLLVGIVEGGPDKSRDDPENPFRRWGSRAAVVLYEVVHRPLYSLPAFEIICSVDMIALRSMAGMSKRRAPPDDGRPTTPARVKIASQAQGKSNGCPQGGHFGFREF
jgi:hypothetical protein